MNIVLACQYQAKRPGGLRSYEMMLERALLENAGLTVSRVALSDSCKQVGKVSSHGSPHISNFVGNPFVNKFVVRRLAHSLCGRPWAHDALEVLLRAYYLPLLRRLRMPPPSVVHFIGTGWLFFGFPLLSWARSHGSLFTVCPAVHPHSWGDDTIDVRLYNKADAVFCLSESERRHLTARGVEHDRLVVVGLPPMCRPDGDSDRFRYSHSLGTRPLVLFMGRRDEGKGYPALLRSWSLVLRVFPDAVLVLAGPGSEDYEDFFSDLPSKSVIDLGIVDEQTKADALAACDVFCLPSAHESFGIVYVEAWLYAKPVVCGTAPACRELIAHGKTGLHSSQDVVELSSALVALLGAPHRASTMGQEGYHEQQSHFTQSAMLEATLRVWQKPKRCLQLRRSA